MNTRAGTFVVLAILVVCVTALWPIPAHVSSGNKTVWFRRDTVIKYQQPQREQNVLSHQTDLPAIVKLAVDRAYRSILTQNFIPWKFNSRSSGFEPSTTDKVYIKSISLQQNVPYSDDGAVDESYTLSISPTGSVTITANSSIGILYGLTTFSQLFYAHSLGGAYMTTAPVTISDCPKFPHRGLNLDTARHFFPPSDIKRTLNAMAFTKMNRFHWHITDAQSWPLVIPSLPELSVKGAYAPSLVYSPADLAEIMDHGNLLGIETVIETDMPGHTSSIRYSHPELIAGFDTKPYHHNCAEPPCGTLKLNDSAVYTLLDTLFADLLPRVSDYSSFYHTGGDEIKPNAYLLDDTVRSNDTAVLQPLVQKFINHIHEKMRAQGLTPVVWEEMLLKWNLTLPSDVIVQSWLGDESVLKIAQTGHRVIVGDHQNWYLDCGAGSWINPSPFLAPNASSSLSSIVPAWPYQDYCSPRKSWRQIYSYDPHASIPSEIQHLVIGGEVHLWSEQIDSTNLDRQAWPRAAAAAEVLWSGAKDPETGANRSLSDAARRLSQFRERLVSQGVMAEPIQMPFCTAEKGACDV